MMRRALLPALICVLPLAGGAAEPEAAARALNALRAEKNRPPLGWSAELEQAAAAHARDMAARGYFSHTGADGASAGDRARAAGYGWCFVAENIAKGQPDLASVLSAWQGSRGHRRNMLSRDVQEFALARAPGNIWVMLLARPGC
jgi:uncharacterized protein YkwD